MRRITALLTALALTPLTAQADAQFTADDIIRHFKKNAEVERTAPAVTTTTPAARTITSDGEEPIKLPLTGAKRGITIGAADGRAAGTTIGKPTGTTIGTTVTSPGLDLLITFESGSDRLTRQAKSNLDAFAQALSSPALQGFAFEVQGHTDARGSATVNMKLSQRRADSVVAYLVGHGIASNRLQARGYGESQPIMSDPNHPKNRRVETRRLR